MSLEAQRTERSASVSWAPSTPTVEKPAAGTAPLLPDPNPPSLDGMQDAMSMMFALVAKQGQNQQASGEVGVRAQNEQQQSQVQQEAAALKQQEADEAKLNCGSLFGSIFHVIDSVLSDVTHGKIFDAPGDAVSGAVNIVDSPQLFTQLEKLAPQVAEYVGIAAACVGAAAFTAATCGTGGIVVAAVVIALSAGGMFVSDTKCFGKDSAYIGLGRLVRRFGSDGRGRRDEGCVGGGAGGLRRDGRRWRGGERRGRSPASRRPRRHGQCSASAGGDHAQPAPRRGSHRRHEGRAAVEHERAPDPRRRGSNL
jgi:hypothetical protein